MSGEIREVMYPKGYREPYVSAPWKGWERVARPYACKSCGQEYPPALAVGLDSGAPEGEWYSSRIGPDVELGTRRDSWRMTNENAWAYCRNPECSRFYDYAKPWRPRYMGAPRRMKMRRRWLRMPSAANGGAYR